MRELKDIVLSSDYENLKYLKKKYSKLIILKDLLNMHVVKQR